MYVKTNVVMSSLTRDWNASATINDRLSGTIVKETEFDATFGRDVLF